MSPNTKISFSGIKNVSLLKFTPSSISNIVNEREKNGQFKSIKDFLNRVNPKDINKLQLEGLTKAGAFDGIISNRRSFYDSIPNLILKSKNIYNSKSQNQKELFSVGINENREEIVNEKSEWNFQEKMFENVLI